MTRAHHPREAFTLGQLLILLLIIAIVLAVLVVALSKVRETESVVLCSSNLRDIGTALHNYAGSDHLPTGGGYFVPGGGAGQRFWRDESLPARGREQEWGWAFQVLPYLEEDMLFKQRRAQEEPATYVSLSTGKKFFYYPESDAEVASHPLRLYACPARRWKQVLVSQEFGTRGVMDYAGNGGPMAHVRPDDTPNVPFYFPPHSGRSDQLVFGYSGPWSTDNNPNGSKEVDPLVGLKDFPDGGSFTILVGEKYVDPKTLGTAVPGDRIGWPGGFCSDTIRGSRNHQDGLLPPRRDGAKTTEHVTPNVGFGSSHVRSMNTLFGDASVRPLSYRIQPEIFDALCNRSNSKPLQPGDLE